MVAAPPPPMAVVAPGTVFNIVRTWPPVATGGSAVAAGGSAVAPPPPPAEYWGNDADTVFVEGLTTARRVSLRWEQEQLENTVQVSATGEGVRTIFRNSE